MSDVFVDENNGSDETGVGTEDAPFATVEAAREWFPEGTELTIHVAHLTVHGRMWTALDEPAPERNPQ